MATSWSAAPTSYRPEDAADAGLVLGHDTLS